MTNQHLLLIGMGNPLAGDDGVGPLLTERIAPLLRQRGIDVHTLVIHQLTPELALEIAHESVAAVIFIDAAVAHGDAASPSIVELLDNAASPNGSHDLSPAAVLIYAGKLFGRRPPAWLVALPAGNFAFGAELSPPLAGLLESPAPVVELIAQALLGRLPMTVVAPELPGADG